MKYGLTILALGLMLPVLAKASPPCARFKKAQAQISQCEAQVKKYADLGQPVKAEKQISQCKKLKNNLALIRKEEPMSRMPASVD